MYDKGLAGFQACLPVGLLAVADSALGFSQTSPLKAEIGFVYRWTRKGEFSSFLSWHSCGLSLGWGVGVERLRGCPGDEVSSSRCQDIVGFNQMQLDPSLPGNRISNSALSSDAARALSLLAS